MKQKERDSENQIQKERREEEREGRSRGRFPLEALEDFARGGVGVALLVLPLQSGLNDGSRRVVGAGVLLATTVIAVGNAPEDLVLEFTGIDEIPSSVGDKSALRELVGLRKIDGVVRSSVGVVREMADGSAFVFGDPGGSEAFSTAVLD